jgi:hypothetical protein
VGLEFMRRGLADDDEPNELGVKLEHLVDQIGRLFMPESGPTRIRVRLCVTPSEDGGRQTGLFDGYRGAFWWGELSENGLRCYYDARLTLEGAEIVAPGNTAYAALQPAYPEYWQQVAVGDKLEMCEGAHVVGVVDVLEIQ